MFKIKPLALALSPMGRGEVVGILVAMADVQVACDNCGKELVPGAAYCERCGARTRRAKRLVSLSIRVELLFFLAVVVMVAGFVWVYAIQK
jgi:uncharacterized OB-fold protein